VGAFALPSAARQGATDRSGPNKARLCVVLRRRPGRVQALNARTDPVKIHQAATACPLQYPG